MQPSVLETCLKVFGESVALLVVMSLFDKGLQKKSRATKPCARRTTL
jgi:hypothetical protein